MDRTAFLQHALDEQPLPRPYRPGWADRLTDWVRGLRLPAWLVYLTLGLPVFVAFTVIKWYDGTYAVGTYSPLHALLALTGAYYLALIHYLDGMAARALDEFRPVLVLHDRSYDELRYRLTTMPARRTLFWSIIGAAVISIYLAYVYYFDRAQAEASLLFTSPLATAFEFALGVYMGLSSGAAIYHSVRQLSVIDHIYTRHTEVDLFKLEPLHAFSRLAAWTSFAFALLTHLWVIYWPSTLDNAVILVPMLAFASMATALFVLPLLGIHRLLVKEKERRKAEAGEQLDIAIGELHRRNRAGDYPQMPGLNDATEALVRVRDVLDKVPTWPWQPDTLRWLGTALLLPIVVWAITRLLERLGL
jgi:hypothetical protein